LAFGIGDKVEDVLDRKLQFEIGRADITVTAYDFVNNQLVFKAPLPDDLEGTVYEIALFSQETNSLAGDFGSVLLTSFDSDEEDWIDPTSGAASAFSTTNTRVGADSLRLVATASTTTRSVLEGVAFDFSGNTSADKFVLACNVSANVSNVKLLLKTDNSNYYTITYTPAAGYRFSGQSLGSAVPTGSPDWEDINMMEVQVTATSGGSATIDFDGIRIEDTDTPNPEYVMVSRELLSVPFVKDSGRIQAIEFAINVSV
jgi:hypothetical protein